LSRLATSFVLGYHGCSQSTANKALKGKTELLLSEMPYDWLGPGVYFWENDPQRALEFAYWKSSRDAQFTNPTVIGAVIDLGNCFDLISRESIEALKAAYNSFVDFRTKDGKEIPKNRNGKNLDEDRSLRFLDCAVIKHFYELADAAGLPPYDTARGMFAEGDVIYKGAGFREKNHVQIAVKNPNCIKGFFVPRPFPTIS
jgi:hypothetical protein